MCSYNFMKSFISFTMKSKQVWMKSKPVASMKLNPSTYSPKAISSRSDFICKADLFRRKTDLVEKSVLKKSVHFFLVEMRRTTHIAKAICPARRPKASLSVPVSHLVVAKSEPLHFLWEITLSSFLLLFHKKPHSANLFSCKRLHND